ncbi:MAG: hypothetical protein HOG34_11090 [Bacteroidetes bacterium]|nr:hypothetical protein [Bacteroidota bacterium]
MSILIQTRPKSKSVNREIITYALCIISYVMLTGVIYQYYGTIKANSFKPDLLLLFLLYTGELFFILLFSPIFALTQFTTVENQSTKNQSINFQMQTLRRKNFFTEAIIKVFILICVFHLISLSSTYNNAYFTFRSYLMMLLVITTLSLFIIGFTSFLVIISRNVSFSIAVTYLTITGISGCVFFISPLLDLMSNPTSVINLALKINPMMAIASILDFDLLRWGIFYESTQIGLFRFSYPHWSVHVLSYLALSIFLYTVTLLLTKYYGKQEAVLTF